MNLNVESNTKRQVLDITDEVQQHLAGPIPAKASGLVNIFVKHTTAAITTADLDPGTDLDFLDFLKAITPDPPAGGWRHPHDSSHTPDHLLASLIGPGVNVPFEKGKLQLGSWQRIILVELDGPRDRQIELTFVNT